MSNPGSLLAAELGTPPTRFFCDVSVASPAPESGALGFAKYHTVLLQVLPTRFLRLGANVLEGRLLNVFESLAIGLPSTILATVGYTMSRFEAPVLCFLESVLLRLCRAEFPFLLQTATVLRPCQTSNVLHVPCMFCYTHMTAGRIGGRLWGIYWLNTFTKTISTIGLTPL